MKSNSKKENETLNIYLYTTLHSSRVYKKRMRKASSFFNANKLPQFSIFPFCAIYTSFMFCVCVLFESLMQENVIHKRIFSFSIQFNIIIKREYKTLASSACFFYFVFFFCIIVVIIRDQIFLFVCTHIHRKTIKLRPHAFFL